MSESNDLNDEARLQAFTTALLEDLRALERMIDEGLIETGIRRIGAEQEMFLIDEAMRPAAVADEILAEANDPRLTNELALFNLEANLAPQRLAGDGLRRLEHELRELVELADGAARRHGARVLLTGILPTLAKRDLGAENMTPRPRYIELDRMTRRMRGDHFHVMIKGLDELETTHDNVMLESCNTSFQLHLQVAPQEFASLYNVAQVVTAPVLAAAVNSPVLLQHRLWAETRIALFQHSLDSRPRSRHHRRERPRVQFGDEWVNDSIVEILREDIARFRIVLTCDLEERPLELLDEGRMPRLRALCLHNGTVWRWNRPCYGVSDGIAHMRIENRVLPAGPTILDELANAAFYYGLMTALPREHERIDRELAFDDAKQNFFAAARRGLDANITWTGGRSWTARSLILEELLPMARSGLADAGVDDDDADRYLAVVRDRVERGRTGSRWIVESLRGMDPQETTDRRFRALTHAMHENQEADDPVASWPLAEIDFTRRQKRDSIRTVGQIMSTDLFTVRPRDVIDLAAAVMDWRHIRHVPVEDDGGRLVGILSYRDLMRLTTIGDHPSATRPVTVESVMQPDPVSISVDAPTLDAIATMRHHRIACLPVVEGDRLVGILTDHDVMRATAWLVEEFLEDGSD